MNSVLSMALSISIKKAKHAMHTGVFSGDVIDEIRAPHDGWVRFLQPLLGQLIRTSHGKIAYLTRANGSFAIELMQPIVGAGQLNDISQLQMLCLMRHGTARSEMETTASLTACAISSLWGMMSGLCHRQVSLQVFLACRLADCLPSCSCLPRLV